MHSESLRDDTEEVLRKVKELTSLDNFYLAGDTALALQLGHRVSVDLDFFSKSEIPETLKKDLSSLGDYSVEKESATTLDGELNGVKVSFFQHPYKQLFPFKNFEGVKVADERDIGAMKINAVSGRASKKDFLDIYFLMKKYSLKSLLSFFEEKYADFNYNKVHILKSLIYFEEASDPMPDMLMEVDWSEVKKKIGDEVKSILKVL